MFQDIFGELSFETTLKLRKSHFENKIKKIEADDGTRFGEYELEHARSNLKLVNQLIEVFTDR